MTQKKLFTISILTLSTLFSLKGLALAADTPPATMMVQIQSVEFNDEPLTPTPIEKPSQTDSVVEKPYTITKDYVSDKHSPFRFSFSERFIDFGELAPSNPINRNLSIEITNTVIPIYSIFASENHPLLHTTGVTIPDTTCDNGACSENLAAPWGSGLTYGFGYRCDNISGLDCVSDFSAKGMYKQFSDSSVQEELGTIVQGQQDSNERKVDLTMQINIPGTQPPGSYSSTIQLLAVPGF